MTCLLGYGLEKDSLMLREVSLPLRLAPLQLQVEEIDHCAAVSHQLVDVLDHKVVGADERPTRC